MYKLGLNLIRVSGFLLYSWCASQSFSALQNSNYAGVNGIYTNPASVTMLTHKRSANIGTFGFEVSNDYFNLAAPFSMWSLISGRVGDEYRNADGKIDWQESWLKTDPTLRAINMNMNSEFRGPAYANQYGRFVWGTATRTRSQLALNGISNQLWTWAAQWIDSQTLINPLNIASQSFSMSANSYQEISAVLGYRIINNSNLKIGLGTSLKGILGMGSVNISNTGVQLKTIGMDSLIMSSGRMELAYTDNNLLKQLFRGVLAGSMPSLGNITGIGYGLDLGITVEFGTDMETEFNERPGYKDYTFKFSAAVLDLGSISYNNQNEGYIINADENPFKMALNTPEFVLALSQGSQAVLDHTLEIARQQGVLKNNNEKTRVVLPSTLQLQADWKILPGILVGAHWQQAMNLSGKWEFIQHSNVSIIPRFEHKWFEFAIPIRYQSFTNSMNFGMHTRMGPVIIGTDNVSNIFKTVPYSGMTFYMGIATLIK